MLTEEQLQEAELILKRRYCSFHGHDYDVQINLMQNMPTGIRCERCGDYWRVFHPVDPPTQLISTIDAPTRLISKQT